MVHLNIVKHQDLPTPPPDRNGWPWTTSLAGSSDTLPNGSSWPRISIITPSYNQGLYLEETVRSVLLQKYPNLEYIIIDGGSTDRSLEVIKKYEPWLDDSVSESDRGQSHAINKGFARCTGDLITFQNSDDIYLPGTFHHVARSWVHHKGPLGAVIGGFYFMDADSEISNQYIPPRIPHAGPIDLSLGHRYRLHQVSTFYTREALDSVGRWVRENLVYTMDRELLYRVCKCYPILTVDRAYGVFRRHERSKSTTVILPFAEEFADVHLSFCSGNEKHDRLRKQAANHHRAKGHLKNSRVTENLVEKLKAMFRVVWLDPQYLIRRIYWMRWLEILGLRNYLHQFVRFVRGDTP